ncbi:MAG: hypothetical protein V1744_01640 [Candidatus Altiarchaeota archaeon]
MSEQKEPGEGKKEQPLIVEQLSLFEGVQTKRFSKEDAKKAIHDLDKPEFLVGKLSYGERLTRLLKNAGEENIDEVLKHIEKSSKKDLTLAIVLQTLDYAALRGHLEGTLEALAEGSESGGEQNLRLRDMKGLIEHGIVYDKETRTWGERELIFQKRYLKGETGLDEEEKVKDKAVNITPLLFVEEPYKTWLARNKKQLISGSGYPPYLEDEDLSKKDDTRNAKDTVDGMEGRKDLVIEELRGMGVNTVRITGGEIDIGDGRVKLSQLQAMYITSAERAIVKERADYRKHKRMLDMI